MEKGGKTSCQKNSGAAPHIAVGVVSETWGERPVDPLEADLCTGLEKLFCSCRSVCSGGSCLKLTDPYQPQGQGAGITACL